MSILSPPLPPHRFSKVMVSPRSLEVDSKWQHSCDFKYQVLVLCILLLKNTTKKSAIVLITTWDYKGSMLSGISSWPAVLRVPSGVYTGGKKKISKAKGMDLWWGVSHLRLILLVLYPCSSWCLTLTSCRQSLFGEGGSSSCCFHEDMLTSPLSHLVFVTLSSLVFFFFIHT